MRVSALQEQAKLKAMWDRICVPESERRRCPAAFSFDASQSVCRTAQHFHSLVSTGCFQERVIICSKPCLALVLIGSQACWSALQTLQAVLLEQERIEPRCASQCSTDNSYVLLRWHLYTSFIS